MSNAAGSTTRSPNGGTARRNENDEEEENEGVLLSSSRPTHPAAAAAAARLSPAAALKVLLEQQQQQQQQSSSSSSHPPEISRATQQSNRKLLQLVTNAGNLTLLERATRELEFWQYDAPSFQSLVTGWARLRFPLQPPSASASASAVSPPRTDKQNQSSAAGRGAGITGAVVATQLLQEWGHKSSSPDSPLEHPPVAVFRTVLTALSTQGNYRAAGQVLEQLLLQTENYHHHYQQGPDRDCFHRVLQACCQAGALEPALDWWDRMREMATYPTYHSSLAPNRSTLKILLQTHINHATYYGTPGTGLAAYQLFQDMTSTTSLSPAGSVEPDAIAINMLLNALAQEGQYELAQALFTQLISLQQQQQQGLQENHHDKGDGDAAGGSSTPAMTMTMADPIPFRTVLKACAQANTIEAAERAEELLRTYYHDKYTASFVDARSYTTVVAIWCKLGEPERAKQLLEELITLYLDHHHHHQQQQQQQPNESLSSSMALDSRWQPDPFSFRTVIGAFSLKIGKLMTNSNHAAAPMDEAVSLAAQAQQVLTDMYTTMGYVPNLITCNTVLNCWAQARQPEAVEDLLQQIEHWNIAPDIISYNTLIACHAKLGNLQDCTTWLSRLAQPPSSSSSTLLPTPNARTVTAVITALSKQGTPQAAEQAEAWFLQMQEWHADHGWDCAPSVVTLNALLTCWARVPNGGGGKRAEFWLRQFHHYASSSNLEPPNTLSYNAVLQTYAGSNSNHVFVSKMESLLEELIAFGLQPNDRTVQIVQRSLERHASSADMKVRKWKEWKQRFFYFIESSKKTTKNKSRSTATNTSRTRRWTG